MWFSLSEMKFDDGFVKFCGDGQGGRKEEGRRKWEEGRGFNGRR